MSLKQLEKPKVGNGEERAPGNRGVDKSQAGVLP